jgi:hypothetical protein
MANMKVASSTYAIADAYEHFSGTVDQYVNAFKTSETQVGACFAVNGKLRGIEMFDVSETCSKLMPKLIRSYALDAIEERQEVATAAAQSISEFIQAVSSAPVDSFKALGEGEDLRIHSNSIAGGALAAHERIVHLCAFGHEPEAERADRSGSMTRASRRHLYRTSEAQMPAIHNDFDDDID